MVFMYFGENFDDNWDSSSILSQAKPNELHCAHIDDNWIRFHI